ncbi:sensor histidine kinase, partial [Kocuria palustris]|uniref:sensor histidine kinase n=1 Tax=Kocuria palustris TaxID=71999 RepID=UPI00246AC955|nr:sensor histidine kinase [Kocuria palustris]
TALDAAAIEARLPGPAGLPAEQQTLLAWCLREAVTNVIRHAQATVCTVEAGPGRLVVEDDGVGTDPGAGTGNGLRGMRERVRQAGGELTLSAADASPDRPGTRLEVRLP